MASHPADSDSVNSKGRVTALWHDLLGLVGFTAAELAAIEAASARADVTPRGLVREKKLRGLKV